MNRAPKNHRYIQGNFYQTPSLFFGRVRHARIAIASLVIDSIESRLGPGKTLPAVGDELSRAFEHYKSFCRQRKVSDSTWSGLTGSSTPISQFWLRVASLQYSVQHGLKLVAAFEF